MLRASYARVQATVGVGTVLIRDFGVAYTREGGNNTSDQMLTEKEENEGCCKTVVRKPPSLCSISLYCPRALTQAHYLLPCHQPSLRMLLSLIVLLLFGTVGGHWQLQGKHLQIPCPKMEDRTKCCSEGWSGEIVEYPQRTTVAISLLVWQTTEWLETALTTILKSDIFEYSPIFVVYFTCTDCQKQRAYIQRRLSSVKYHTLGGQGIQGIVVPRITVMEWTIQHGLDFLLEMHDDMVFPRRWFGALLSHMGHNVAVTMPAILRCFPSSPAEAQLKEMDDRMQQLQKQGKVCFCPPHPSSATLTLGTRNKETPLLPGGPSGLDGPPDLFEMAVCPGVLWVTSRLVLGNTPTSSLTPFLCQSRGCL